MCSPAMIYMAWYVWNIICLGEDVIFPAFPRFVQTDDFMARTLCLCAELLQCFTVSVAYYGLPAVPTLISSAVHAALHMHNPCKELSKRSSWMDSGGDAFAVVLF